MVRSEGGEDVYNFNSLSRWAKGKCISRLSVLFKPQSAVASYLIGESLDRKSISNSPS